MVQDDDAQSPIARVGGGYPAAQLARALTHVQEQDDPSAQERVRRWTDVLIGVLSGAVSHGQRQPIANLPTWVTLEVVTGGFATGEALSAGPLRPHEQQLLGELGLAGESEPRLALNRFFLSDAGLQRLADALQDSQYEIDVPEEGALLVVAWLTVKGHVNQARALIKTLAPHMSRLRLYPALTEVPRSGGTRVCRETVGATARRLREVRPNPRVLAQREAIGVWTPLYDRLVALFLETVIGELPVAKKDDTGAWRRGPSNQFIIEGGWPCARYPADWRDRAAALMAEIQSAREAHRRCGKVTRPEASFARLIASMERALADPAQLTGREVGRIRLALARYVAARDRPDSERALALRSRQWRHATALTNQEIACHVSQRLATYQQNDGLDDLVALTADIQPEETGQAFEHGVRIPSSVIRKLERCVCDSVEGLVKRGIIPSGEVLAQILPQLTSGLRAAGIADRALRELYAAIYRAFRRRRSLLLLDLQKQVQLEELPWVREIESHRRADVSSVELARQALVETSVLALKAFPQAILPNKLIQELGALARAANLTIPLTEEVAADIFMGQFSPKFTEAVGIAARLLRGSIYARYYRIDYDDVLKELAGTGDETDRLTRRPDSLAQLCAVRAGVTLGTYRPAINGQVIEQQLILTTHNLAALAVQSDIGEALRHHSDALARQCFEWVLRQLQLPDSGYHVQLIRIKNAAYAWRQLVFFLSLQEDRAQEFLDWTDERLSSESDSFRYLFEPALQGLAATVGRVDKDEALTAEHTIFLGWSSARHWLMPPVPKRDAPTRS